ncbi:unnamed protein product [Boreogadus saida]
MPPADCRVKIEMDDYGEGACGVASGSLVRGRTQRVTAAVEKDDVSRIVRSADCLWPPERRQTWRRLSHIEPAEMALSAEVFTVELLREQARAQRPLLFRLWGQKFRGPKLFSLADL